MKKIYDNNHIENFPFLTIAEFNEEEIVGIVQKIKDNYVYIYVFNIIKSGFLRGRFLELGNKWWWESNRMVPINIFFNEEFEVFKDFLRIYNLKNFNIIYSPEIFVQKTKKYKKRTNLVLIN